MMDQIVPPEDQLAKVREVWERCQAEIEQAIERGIRVEMTTKMQSMAHRMVATELGGLIRPLLDAKKDELQKAAITIVDGLAAKLEVEIRNSIRNIFEDQFYDFTEEVTKYTKKRLHEALNKVLAPEPSGAPREAT